MLGLRRPVVRLVAALFMASPLSAQGAKCPAATGADTASRYSPEELRRIGLQLLDRRVRAYGRVKSETDRREVGDALGRIVTATGAPLDVRWDLVGDADINAAALPGGIMVVNEGLIAWLRHVVAAEHLVGETARARRAAYLGAVLGHEMAHITLGHVDSLANEDLRCPAARLHRVGRLRGDTLNPAVERELADALAQAGKLREARDVRAVESAADHVGALYLLRAGWSIQDAMDLFRRFDELERAGASAGVGDLTWFIDHPRSSQREAALEQLRGTLKLHQGEFDDALILVRHGVMLDSALAMLDRVLVDFPRLAPVRHARAVAVHELWMQSTSPSVRQVQTTTPTYETTTIGRIRAGGVGDAALLDSARHEYRRVLALERLPFALSNLAVLDAYAGDVAIARARADSAVRALPKDDEVANNRAAVRYLTDDLVGARAAWIAQRRRAFEPSVTFNLARVALATGDTAAAHALLEEYVQNAEDDDPWSHEARRLLGQREHTSARTTSRVAASAGGIALGMTDAQVRVVLGPPDADGAAGAGRPMRYAARGLEIVMDQTSSVALITAKSAAAGQIDGVRVGDAMRDVKTRWGAPIAMRGDLTAYDRGGWLAIVERKGTSVASLTVRGE